MSVHTVRAEREVLVPIGVERGYPQFLQVVTAANFPSVLRFYHIFTNCPYRSCRRSRPIAAQTSVLKTRRTSVGLEESDFGLWWSYEDHRRPHRPKFDPPPSARYGLARAGATHRTGRDHIYNRNSTTPNSATGTWVKCTCAAVTLASASRSGNEIHPALRRFDTFHESPATTRQATQQIAPPQTRLPCRY